MLIVHNINISSSQDKIIVVVFIYLQELIAEKKNSVNLNSKIYTRKYREFIISSVFWGFFLGGRGDCVEINWLSVYI